MTYYAIATNSQGRIEQLLVTREMNAQDPAKGRQISQVWTGVVYRNTREGMAAVGALNANRAGDRT